MRILNWVQNKFTGRQEKNKSDVGSSSSRHTTMPDIPNEEFSDWAQGLLAIGTLGNSELKEDITTYDSSKNLHALQDQPNLRLEEVIKLQKELATLFALEPNSSTNGSEMEWEKDNGNLSPNSKIIFNRAKNLLADNRNAMKKISISFLLRKLFVCKSGFGPARNLREPLTESKIEKLLKTILHKKIHPQNSNSTSKMKCLEEKPEETAPAEDKMHEKEMDGGKWVKTDSEYIVLEM